MPFYVFYGYARVWTFAAGLIHSLGWCQESALRQDMLHGVVFTVLLSWIWMLVKLPFSIYATFVIEEKYGFNKTTVGTFIGDIVKSQLLSVGFTALLLPLILWVVDISGENLVFYLVSVSVAFVLLLQILVPTFIIPLFYKYTELEEGELKQLILKEAEKTHVSVAEIKKIDGSRRSSHSNAFVSGIYPFRKVVLFDTLIEQHSNPEILAVVNHELGHVAHKHILRQVLSTVVQLTIMFSLFSFCLGNTEIVKAFRFPQETKFVYLFLFNQLYAPSEIISTLFVMRMIRQMEYQADDFAVKYGHGENLKKGLVNLFKRNKGPLSADPLYSALHHSHPTLLERMMNIDKQIKKGQ